MVSLKVTHPVSMLEREVMIVLNWTEEGPDTDFYLKTASHNYEWEWTVVSQVQLDPDGHSFYINTA